MWCCRILLILLLVFLSGAIGGIFASKPVRRLAREDDMTSVLVAQPIWLREVYYRLQPELQKVLRFIEPTARRALIKEAFQSDAKHRTQIIKDRLTAVLHSWYAQGYEIVIDRSDAPLRKNSDATYIGSEVEFDGDNTLMDVEASNGTVGEHRFDTTRTGTSSLLVKAYEISSSDGRPVYLQVTHTTGNQLKLDKIPAISSEASMFILPLFTSDNNVSHILQFRIDLSNLTMSELKEIPDEFFRLVTADQLSRVDSDKLIKIIQQNIGDISITGSCFDAVNSVITDSANPLRMESMSNKMSNAEKKFLVGDLISHWLNLLKKYSAREHSVSSLCQLTRYISLEQLLEAPSMALKILVGICSQTWLDNSQTFSQFPLGRFSRVWFEKVVESDIGPVYDWSTNDLAKNSVLLTGALVSELDRIPIMRKRDTITSLTSIGFNRAQAQPVLDALLESSPLSALRSLSHHLQPWHVRAVHERASQLHDVSHSLFTKTSHESVSFATLVQAQLVLGDLPENVTSSDLYRLGKFFFTLPLHKIYSVYEQNVPLSVDLLNAIYSASAEPLALRVVMTLFMQQPVSRCNTCLDGVPSAMLSSMGDASLASLQHNGGLTPHVVQLLTNSADSMYDGKRAFLLDTVRGFIRESIGRSSVSRYAVRSESLWRIMSPTDLENLLPPLLYALKTLKTDRKYETYIGIGSRFPRKTVSKILDHLLNEANNTSKPWMSENLLPKRTNKFYDYGPWIFLSKVDCHHVTRIHPLDIIPIAEEIDRQLTALDYVMPLDLCVCLKQKIIEYLRLKHTIKSQENKDVVQFLLDGQSKLNDVLLSPLSKAEAYAIPPCILALFSKTYLSNQRQAVRLIVWQRIASIKWPQLLQHIYVQQDSKDFGWFAEQLLADLDFNTRNTFDNANEATSDIKTYDTGRQIGFRQLSSLNQLVHFVDDQVIDRVNADAFRQWIMTLRLPRDRLVCRPNARWQSVMLRAFGKQPSHWNSTTLYRLGGWVFALNDSNQASVDRQTLRLSLEAHLSSLFTRLVDVVDGASGQTLSFVAACKQLGDTSINLSMLWQSAKLGGVVGSPVQPITRPSSASSQLQQVSQLNNTLQMAISAAAGANTSFTSIQQEASEAIGRMMEKMQLEKLKESQLQVDFWPKNVLRCADFRSAGEAAVAVTRQELESMMRDNREELWSCLGHLGQLDWRLNPEIPRVVWQLAKPMLVSEHTSLSSEHIVTLGGLVAHLPSKYISPLAVWNWADGWKVSTDALSVLGSQRWPGAAADELKTLVKNVLRVSTDPQNNLVRLYSQPAHIAAMGSLLCGLNGDMLRELFFNNFTQPQLYRDSSAIIGQRALCDDIRPLRVLAEMAVAEFGAPHLWDQLVVETVGVVVAGLSDRQLASIPPVAMRGLLPEAAYRVVQSNNGYRLRVDHLRHLPPASARELLRHTGYSSQKLLALRHAMTGGDRKERSAKSDDRLFVTDSASSTNSELSNEVKILHGIASSSESASPASPSVTRGVIDTDDNAATTETSIGENSTEDDAARQARVKQAGIGGASVARACNSVICLVLLLATLKYCLP